MFVFARDLSEVTEQSFTARLAQHHAAAQAGTVITRWGLSELVRRLNEHQHLIDRFFGPDLEPLWQALNRTITAGGALEDERDLIERARTLSTWAEARDGRFTQSLTTSSLDAPEPQWVELPYMTLQIADSSTRVNIAAWAREGAEIGSSLFGFLDNETGAKARSAAINQLARGEPAEIREGAHVEMDAPEIMRAVAPEEALKDAAMTLHPGAPLPLGIEISGQDGAVARSVDMYNVPPPPGAVGAMAGYSGSVLVQVTVRLLKEPRIRLELQLSSQFESDVRANAMAAELLLAFHREKEATLKSELLFPGGELTAPLREKSDEEKVRELEILHTLFGSLVFIEDRVGTTLTPPPEVSPEDVDALLTMRRVLETGEGTATFQGMTGTLGNPQEIAWIAEQTSGTIQQRPVVYEVFGQEVTLGTGAYELPRLKVVEVIPHGTTPNAPARVVLGADEDPTMTFRLL